MKKQEKEPFLPFITVDDIVKFDPEREETYTESRFINAVLRAIYKVGAPDAQCIAAHLALEEHVLNHGVSIACGMNLTGLRSIATIAAAARMRAKDPKSSLDDVANLLGYGNRSSVWGVLNNKKYAEIVRRLCPELLEQRHQVRLSDEEWARILAAGND